MAKKKNPKKAKAGTKKAVKKALVKKAKKAAKKAVKKAKKLSSPKKKAKPTKKLKKVAKKPIKKAAKPAKKQSKKAKPVKKVVKKVAKKQKVVAKKKALTKSSPIKLKKASPKKPVKSNKPPLPSIISHPDGEPATPSFVAHKSHLRAGSTAPYFEAKDQHGNTVNLYSLNGKTVILYFYPKDDTPGCTKEACSLRDEYKYLSDNNYAVIGVSADDAVSHGKFAAKYELPFPLLADTDMTIIKAYDVWGPKMLAGRIYDGIVRTTFIIDGYGIIQNVIHDVDTENHAKQILAL